MYDIRQFRPALYALVVLGLSGYAMAAESAGVWVLSVGLVVLNAWLVRTGRFRPLPRWVANTLTVLGLAYVITQARHVSGPPILLVGQFLVLLQLVKLYEQRANRDYAQLLVLSLLLMVAAAINTASLLFGVTFIAYLFLSLYCCLLFHLKVETDHAKAVLSPPGGGAGAGAAGYDRFDAPPAVLRQDQRHLGSSMRRLTGLVSAAAIVTAVVVFVAFPRGTGQGVLTPYQPFRPGQTLTGFDDQVSFQSIARITQNTAEVAKVTVRVRKPGEADFGEPRSVGTLLLRGTTLDYYEQNPRSGNRWQWMRLGRPSGPTYAPDRGTWVALPSGVPEQAGDRYLQSIALAPTGTSTLFSIAGPAALKPGVDGLRFHLTRSDQAIKAQDLVRRRLQYDVISTGVLPAYVPPARGELVRGEVGRGEIGRGEVGRGEVGGGVDEPRDRIADARDAMRGGLSQLLRDFPTRPLPDSPAPPADGPTDGPPTLGPADVAVAGPMSLGDGLRPPAGADPDPAADVAPAPASGGDRVLAYALRPEVSGDDPATGRSLGARRLNVTATTDLDAQIAANIEQHLQTAFAYTLDLTDARLTRGQDPVEAFLYDLKRGHCEYFAGAMALMCQKLGLDARVVVGFKCDEYNPYGGFYTVRQSHAHAWVEVLTPAGWQTFDPTSGRDAGEAADAPSLWARARQVFGYLEYKWGENVVAYDSERRTGLIERADVQLTNTAIQGTASASRLREWFGRGGGLYIIGDRLLSTLVGLMVAGLAMAVAWFLFERLRLRRRARRIGLDALPEAERVRLARQLGFYDDLLTLLGRHGVVRPAHLTPLEFSHTVDHLPADAYDAVRRLTQIFYRVRYGDATLSPARRRRLDRVIERVERTLDRP